MRPVAVLSTLYTTEGISSTGLSFLSASDVAVYSKKRGLFITRKRAMDLMYRDTESVPQCPPPESGHLVRCFYQYAYAKHGRRAAGSNSVHLSRRRRVVNIDVTISRCAASIVEVTRWNLLHGCGVENP